jgi:hypothetical protein
VVGLPILAGLERGPAHLGAVVVLAAAFGVLLTVPLLAQVWRWWVDRTGRLGYVVWAGLAATLVALLAVIGSDVHGVLAMRQPAGIGSSTVGRAVLNTARPAVIVGGSAAYGWVDATGRGYVRRALTTFSHTTGIPVVSVDDAIPGSPMTNPSVAAAFPRWMRETAGGIAVLAWGLLNDARLHIPPAQDRAVFRREMEEALATQHVVLLVSPPPTTAGETTQRSRVNRLWRMEQAVAQRFSRKSPGRVDVLNVMGPEMRYITANGQEIQTYMQGLWDPNTSGHKLAARFLVRKLEHSSRLPRSLSGGIGQTLRHPGFVARYVLLRTRGHAWAYVEPGRLLTKLAAFVNAHPGWTFLVDSQSYWGLVPLVRHRSQLVLPGDPAFSWDLNHPASGVTAFIAPQMPAVGRHDRLDAVYPKLLARRQMTWATVVWHGAGTRILHIDSTAPQ